jgi:LPS-assembly protein
MSGSNVRFGRVSQVEKLSFKSFGNLVLVIGCVSSTAFYSGGKAYAQGLNPDRKTVFSEDTAARKRQEQQKIRQVTSAQGEAAPGVDFQAPIIEFDRNKNEVIGKGGVTISDSGVQVQADQGAFNTETREGVVSGNVVVSTSAGVLGADTATFKMPTETGEFGKIDFEVEDGGFHVLSEKARKVSEFEFELDDSSFTTCHCADGARPWEVKSDRCSITQEGYAHSYDSKLYFEGLPIFYTPYLAFPVKNERASGLLPPQWGIGNRDGFMFRQPVLAIIDDSSDLTISPFIATKSRVGAEVEYQRVFSRTNKLTTGLLYSDESLRGDSLRGLNISDATDPTTGQEIYDASIDKNRLGAYYKHRWTPDPKLDLPIEFVADGRYTSDNLFLREIAESDIGDKQSQFLTSTAVLRGRVLEAINAEGRAEYNQMLLSDQDVQTQRVPELSLSTGETFRPWGFNPYGLKLVTNAGAVATDFVRQDGYDGWRYDLNPRTAVPFHISNYMKGQFSAELHQTQYNLRDTMLPSTATPLPDGSTELDSSSSRTLPILGYGMSTGVERVFEVDRGGWLSRLANMGAKYERSELVRLKHTVEPMVQYTYIPGVSQEDLPLFDQLDRYRERSLVSYGFTSRLYGRFMQPLERTRSVEELTSSGQTLPMVDLGSSVLDFGRNMVLAPAQNVDLRIGEVRQLALLSARQTYDFQKASNTQDMVSSDPSLDPFSDLNLGLSLSPSTYFSAGAQTNYHMQDSTFSSYALSVGLMDDREDTLRARYTFVGDSAGSSGGNTLGQLEANAEVALHSRFKAGAYVRYDTEGSQVIESRGLLRFVNSCRCWSMDLGYGETINPDRKQVLFAFTFGGLGGITQGVGLPQGGGQQ